jgi:hydrophobic/amphiphilic exporter-1 (mainly G- bacteria), HAE1 family
MNIAGLAIKRPIFIVMMILSIITLGIIGFLNLPVDQFPDVTFPTINVTIIYSGASAEEMETLVSKPMEDAFATLEGIDKVNSTSSEGVSNVTAKFKLGFDVKYAESKVRDKVSAVKPTLPKDIREPVITRLAATDMPIIYYSVEGKSDSATLRELIEDKIQPSIEQVEGVASVVINGGRKRIVKITVDKAMLQAKGLNVNLIIYAINARNLNYPVGVVEGQIKDTTLRVVGEFANIQEIADMPIISTTGKIIRIKDIAKVDWTVERETSTIKVNQKSALLMSIYKQSGSNSLAVADKVAKKLIELEKDILPKDVVIKTAIDMTEGIKRSTEGVEENMALGAILALLIVWLFLGNFRSAIITAVALPNSIIGAFFLISIAGFSINMITLLSLSLAVGLLIDDSIVVRENIFRHIELGMPPKEAAEKGTNEVALAVLSTTLSIVAVFLPISFLTGIIGQFFKQFGFTIAFALGISLVDAFTTAPMLSAYWYKEDDNKPKKGFEGFIDGLSKKWNKFYEELNGVYKQILVWALNRKKIVIFSTIGLLVLSFCMVPFIGMGFMSQNTATLVVNFETYPGAHYTQVASYMSKLEDFLTKMPEVESYFSLAGSSFSAAGGGGGAGGNTGEIMLSLVPISKRKLTPDEISQKIRNYVKEQKIDKFVNVITSQGMGGGGNDEPLLVKLYGDDLNVLAKFGAQVKKIMQETPGTADADSSLKPGQPELVLKVDPIKAEKLGVSTLDVGTILRTLIEGDSIAKYRKGEKEYDITVELNDKNKRVPEDVKTILITSKTGKKIPLSAICSFTYASGPVQIDREDKMRIVKISASLAPGYSVIEVKNKIVERLKKELILPGGYRYEFGGQSSQFNDMAVQISGAMLLAILFMYMILASLYNSLVQPLILMTAIPLAVIGAFAALLISGYQLDVFAFIGILMVLGLVAKNGILLLDFTNKKREQGMPIRKALLEAAPIRLRPILMTTFAMIFGMLPIALSVGEGAKGNESLATVVIGGLITSTFLTLVVVPIVYEWVETHFEKRKTVQLNKTLHQRNRNYHQ